MTNKFKNEIMKLEHYFRLIVGSIFQSSESDYDRQYFYCPKIVCKDGFNVSLQINNGNYCESENGYRELGVDWKKVEFGFPSLNDEDMLQYGEGYGLPTWDSEGEEIPFDESKFDITNSVGSIPVEVMQKVCDKHGGIDWDKTLSIESITKFMR